MAALTPQEKVTSTIQSTEISTSSVLVFVYNIWFLSMSFWGLHLEASQHIETVNIHEYGEAEQVKFMAPLANCRQYSYWSFSGFGFSPWEHFQSDSP